MVRTGVSLALLVLLFGCGRSSAPAPGSAVPILPVLEPSPAPTPIADPCGDGDGLDPLAHGNCVLTRARSATPGGSDLQLTTADTPLGQRALAQSAATLDP